MRAVSLKTCTFGTVNMSGSLRVVRIRVNSVSAFSRAKRTDTASPNFLAMNWFTNASGP